MEMGVSIFNRRFNDWSRIFYNFLLYEFFKGRSMYERFLFFFVGYILIFFIVSFLFILFFLVLKFLYDSFFLIIDDGVLLRRMFLEIWAIYLILVCLFVFSYYVFRVLV